MTLSILRTSARSLSPRRDVGADSRSRSRSPLPLEASHTPEHVVDLHSPRYERCCLINPTQPLHARTSILGTLEDYGGDGDADDVHVYWMRLTNGKLATMVTREPLSWIATAFAQLFAVALPAPELETAAAHAVSPYHFAYVLYRALFHGPLAVLDAIATSKYGRVSRRIFDGSYPVVAVFESAGELELAINEQDNCVDIVGQLH